MLFIFVVFLRVILAHFREDAMLRARIDAANEMLKTLTLFVNQTVELSLLDDSIVFGMKVHTSQLETAIIFNCCSFFVLCLHVKDIVNARMDYVFRLVTPHKRRLSFRQRTSRPISAAAMVAADASVTAAPHSSQSQHQSLHFITLLELMYELCNDLTLAAAATTPFVTLRGCRMSADSFLEQLDRLDSVLGWMLIDDDSSGGGGSIRSSDYLVMNRQESFVQMLSNLTRAIAQSTLHRELRRFADLASMLLERPCSQLHNATTSLNRIEIVDYEQLLNGENDCLGLLSPKGRRCFFITRSVAL